MLSCAVQQLCYINHAYKQLTLALQTLAAHILKIFVHFPAQRLDVCQEFWILSLHVLRCRASLHQLYDIAAHMH